MRKMFATRHRLGNNGLYPCLSVNWSETNDQMGFEGVCRIWIDGNTVLKCIHGCDVREGNPIGSISFYLDNVMSGCWRMGSIEGTEITKRDLQLITAWAALAIESRHRSYDGHDLMTTCNSGTNHA